MIGPHLNRENYQVLLRKTCRRSMREVQALVAGLKPQERRRDTVRVIAAPSPLPQAIGEPASEPRLPEPNPARTDFLFPGTSEQTETPPSQPAERRLRFSFDGPEHLDQLLNRARDLMRHKYPYGEAAAILEDALNALLERVDPERRFKRRRERQLAKTRRANSGTKGRGRQAYEA